ncbi:MAG: glycoside hydrolase family 26 protein [Solirubrobacteraceae bacterium]
MVFVFAALGAAIAVPASIAGSAQVVLPAVDSARVVPMGVYHGPANTSAVVRFEQRLGRRVELAHDYLDKRSWKRMTHIGWMTKRWAAAGFSGRMVFTVPMIPDTGGSLKRGAAGRYNKHFRLLAQRLVAGGQRDSILRVGPEFNGQWFKWTMMVRNGGTHYARFWRQIVTTMRAVPGANFKFDWAVNAGSAWVNGGRRQLRAATAYPGDAYVDFIGMDVYDQSWAPHRNSARKRWREFVNQHDGLRWHARFAAAHGKPMSIPEWGLVRRRDGRGGGDNPYFIAQMHNWIQSHEIAYHLYFESTDPNAQYGVFSGDFPRSAESFARLFGKVT